MNSTALHQTILDYLDHHFPSFSDDLKDILAANCMIRTFETGDQLVQTGQYFKSTMLVVDGLVKLYRENDEGAEFFVYYLNPGDACALSMICATRQEKSQILARAMEKTTTLLVPIAMMDELMRTHKTWYYFVLETYRARFEELLEVIDGIAFKSMDERLEFYLRNQQKQFGAPEFSITHQQIADDLNSSREVISRLLKKMEQRGELKLGRNTIILTNQLL